MAEGNETPGDESGAGMQPEGISRRSEGDLLAERRARRAAESGEHALIRRAEAAEATVRTLETHVASLQQRLREVGEERRRISELIEAERDPPPGRSPPPDAEPPPALERELRRVKQREYAEQRLRVEAEERCAEVERDGRAEIDELNGRLNASEHDARVVAARLAGVERELAEAEQAAAAERAAMRRTEQLLRVRLSELERSAVELDRSLSLERAARERAERLLASVRRGHRVLEGIASELAGLLGRLKSAAASQSAPPVPAAPAAPAPVQPAAPVREQPAIERQGPLSDAPGGGELAEALAAAVERLRARAEEHPAEEQASAPAPRPAPHKHSMSLITRLRIARKQRRKR